MRCTVWFVNDSKFFDRDSQQWPADYKAVHFVSPDRVITCKDDLLDLCEDIFDTLNIRQPEGWQYRSMSVGDVVQFGEIAFKCATQGWKEVTEYAKN